MNVISTDVLIIGGGIAGCFAAIRAKKLGCNVAILEKATLRRSGSVGPGMDHVSLGIHPLTINYEQARAFAKNARKDLNDPNITLSIDLHAYERVKDMESFGVPIREDDGSYFVWNDPDRHFCCVSYRGVDTKVKLAEEVKRLGIQIYDRTMGVSLLCKEGEVIGSIGMNTRTGMITAFYAKSVVLCTGETTRQYIAPDGPYNTYFAQTNSGDSEAMAFRAGAKMVNMEFLYWDYVILRAGGGIVGVKPLRKMGKLLNRYGEPVLNNDFESINRCFIMQQEIINGHGPLYWDLHNVPEEDLKMYEREMSNEWPITKEWYKQRKINIRTDKIPMKLDPCCIMGGPLVDDHLRTTVPGLYAAGATTAVARAIVGASVTGDIAGETAAIDSYGKKLCTLPEKELQQIESSIKQPLNNSNGISPVELELSVRKVLTEYVGYYKSATLMEYAAKKISDLKNQYSNNLRANNIHELTRCNEVHSIIDCAQMHIAASLYRKESRFRHLANYVHFRVDYPETDPAWEKWIVLSCNSTNHIGISTMNVPELKEDSNECEN